MSGIGRDYPAHGADDMDAEEVGSQPNWDICVYF